MLAHFLFDTDGRGIAAAVARQTDVAARRILQVLYTDGGLEARRRRSAWGHSMHPKHAL